MQQGGQSLSSYQWPTLQSRVAYFGQYPDFGTGLFPATLAWFEMTRGLFCSGQPYGVFTGGTRRHILPKFPGSGTICIDARSD